MTSVELDKIAELLLAELRITKTFSIQTLLQKFKINFSELEQIIALVSSWGYELTLDDDSLTFVSAPDALIDSEISFQLETIFVGQKVIAFQAVQSTNKTASTLADQGAKEGTIVVAEKQTQGKGRFGRNWHSIEKKGIYCSIILRPPFSPEFAPGLSLMTAVALADTLKGFTDANVQIKWPNDILLNGKKTAGILTELSAEKNRINHVIVGVGININHSKNDFSDELLNRATSIAIENKAVINRVDLLKKFLVYFESMYELYKSDRLKTIHNKLLSYSSLLGTNIQLSQGNELIDGKVVDINNNGALVLESHGKEIVINSGEVTVVKK